MMQIFLHSGRNLNYFCIALCERNNRFYLWTVEARFVTFNFFLRISNLILLTVNSYDAGAGCSP